MILENLPTKFPLEPFENHPEPLGLQNPIQPAPHPPGTAIQQPEPSRTLRTRSSHSTQPQPNPCPPRIFPNIPHKHHPNPSCSSRGLRSGEASVAASASSFFGSSRAREAGERGDPVGTFVSSEPAKRKWRKWSWVALAPCCRSFRLASVQRQLGPQFNSAN